MDELDHAFFVSFQAIEWVCKNELDHFNKADQGALL
jgi:hypothetical protein